MVLALALLVVLFVAIARPPIIGDFPAYKNVLFCPSHARYVVENKNLPGNLIHSCEEEKLELEGQTKYLVDIGYGAGMDCPAGCIYNGFRGLVNEKSNTIEEIKYHENDAIYSLITSGEFKEPDSAIRFNCPEVIRELTAIKLGSKNGKLGWIITFKRPYKCTWFQGTFSRVTRTGVTQEGYEMLRDISGSAFVEIEEPHQIDGSGMSVQSSRGKDIQYEEPYAK